MTILQTIILGIVQGLTEFLPVSSSGHLVLVPFWLGWKLPTTEIFIFDVLVQVATLAAVFAYFWRDLWRIGRAWVQGMLQRQPFADPAARLGWFIILATLPAGIVGLLIKDWIEALFSSPAAAAAFLLLTGGLLMLAEGLGRRARALTAMTWTDALVIGLFQALAILPGVSRSGSTIVGGTLRGFQRAEAARFSFLISIPIMLAAGLLATLDLLAVPNLGAVLPVFLPGFLAAGIVGYLAIRWLLRYLVNHSLNGFAIYCFVIGGLSLIVFWMRG
jgi:undecaprenyl-diphosphatase